MSLVLISASIIFIVSLLLALRALRELETPEEVKRLLRKKANVSGVILFLKKKVIHYTT